jgi:Protein of unknown function (DUF3370)
MLPLLASLLLTQNVPPAPPKEYLRSQEVRSLPGSLDSVPVFNSNSPELVLNEGILLSTFPPMGMQVPAVHLNYAFEGRFDLFAHHIAKGSEKDLRTLYTAVIVHNPGSIPVTIDLMQSASYLSQPDAPFIDLPPVQENNDGKVFSGPGGRAGSELLRPQAQTLIPPVLVIPPGENRLLFNLPIPVKTLTPPLNGRSTMQRLRSTGKVYLASLALFAKTDAQGNETAPELANWETLLKTADRSVPRDKIPTPIEQKKGNLIYSRVGGVSQGATWRGFVTDPGESSLAIPAEGKAISFGIATLHRGDLGTGQNQSAPMLKRYPDTAYQAHGNYAVQYNLSMPLLNKSDKIKTVVVTIESPVKKENPQEGLYFFNPLPKAAVFRGTVRFRYSDDYGMPQTEYFHLVQRRGQEGNELVKLQLQPNSKRTVKVDLIYPPDATPPQVLTVKTLD